MCGVSAKPPWGEAAVAQQDADLLARKRLNNPVDCSASRLVAPKPRNMP